MLFFGRRKKREDEDDEEDELEDRRRSSRRKYRDQNAEDRPRRKSPPKPWGKKERFLILFFLLFTMVPAAFFAASSRKWKLPGLPRFEKPNFNFEQTIVLENTKTPAPDMDRMFEDQLNQITTDLSGLYGVYLVDLRTGATYGFNETQVMQAASLIKLPVMALMYKEAQIGNISLSTKYAIKVSDKIGGSGSLFGKPEGFELTYRDLIKYMGKESDNTAFNIAKKILGEGKINAYTKQIGMSSTSLSENLTTPKEVGKFFMDLWEGRLLLEEDREELLEYLTDTIYEDWIPTFIPNVRVAHKYGAEVHVLNDAGVVFDNNPYVLVVMSDGIIEKESYETLPKIIEYSATFAKN